MTSTDQFPGIQWFLWEIQKGAKHVSQLIAFVSTYLLRKVGKYPYDTDSYSGEIDQFPGYYPSHLSPANKTKRNHDDEIISGSDGLCSMDYFYL